MAADDKEKRKLLVRLRDAARADISFRIAEGSSRIAEESRKGGRWLAAIPLTVAVLLLLLMMPRATEPDAVPLPRVDERVLRSVAASDDARAAAAEAQRLPGDVLAVGTALRLVNGAEARQADEAETHDARRQLETAIRALAPRAGDDLLSLRALQTRHFLDAIAHWEKTGEKSPDFVDLASSFIERSTDAGWVSGRHVLLPETPLRVAFKTVWNALTGVSEKPAFALTLDEQRALYAFYIQHPHPSESHRLTLETQLQAATTPEMCRGVELEVRRHTELWRADKIKKLGELDSSYPTKYALGVVYYRAGRFDLSADAFAGFLGTNPDGPYALRAKNHLKAALTANGPF